MNSSTTRLVRHIRAPRAEVYRALIDPRAVAAWMVPTGMTSEVHRFEAREGGRFRISLTYDAPTGTGKSTAHTDTYHGRFVRLVPGERVVQVMEFETADPAMQGEMRVTFTLADAPGGTGLLAVHDQVPPGVSPADNEAGWRMSLDKLAALLEGDGVPPASAGDVRPPSSSDPPMPTNPALREQLARSLAWSDAHVSLDDAVRGLPAALRGARPPGLPHSPWELVEHLRLAQRDILEFCVGEAYRELEWPADYWPATPAPPDDEAWERSLAEIRSDREALQRLATDGAVDLASVARHGTDQSYLRELLLVVDHTAYHVGQLVLVRQLLGAWPAS